MTNSVLSLYGSHDASATFVDKNGDLRIFELERFSNIRYAMYSSEFDSWSLGVGEKIREEFLNYVKEQINVEPETVIYSSVLNQNDLQFISEIFPNSKLESFDGHHISHAYGSYFQSPFDEALVFTVDGGGSDFGAHTTTKVYKAVGNEIIEIHKSGMDFGNAYSLIGVPISEVSPGKDNNDLGVFLSYAGKVMGICAYGNVIDEWISPMESFYHHRDLQTLGNQIGLNLSLNSLSGEHSYNLAATSQYVFEKLLLDFILGFFEEDKRNIVLTGGCALNVVFNQKLKKVLCEKGFDVYVPPNPNDCGQSLGQYLYKVKGHIQPLVYSGFDILDRGDINFYLENGSYTVEDTNIEKREIPWKYTFIDPFYVDVAAGALSSFVHNKQYVLTLPADLRRIINAPKSPAEQEIVSGLPTQIVEAAKTKKAYPLDTDKISVFHYKKDDWQAWAFPMIYAIMDDIVVIEKLKLADMAALDGAISNIRIFKLGSLEHKIAPTKAATAKLAQILEIGRAHV